MKNLNEKNEDIKFSLPVERVFYVCKDDKVEIVIANKDFTKFRTLDQLIEMKGDITSKIISIPMGEIFNNVRNVYDRYNLLFREKKMCKKDYFVYEKELKPQKLQEYLHLKQNRDRLIESIISEPNKFLNKKGQYQIASYGEVICCDDAYYILCSSMNTFKNEKWYFLSSGERLEEACKGGRRYSSNWESVSELRKYQNELQETYDHKKESVEEAKQAEENTEKYLEF